MKTAFKHFSIFVFISIWAISCSKKEDIKPNDIAGTWNLQSSEGTAKKIGELATSFLSKEDLSDLSFLATQSYTFKSDGSFTMIDSKQDTYGGTYSVSGNKLNLIFEDFSTSKIDISYTISLTDSKMVLTSDINTLISFLDSLKNTLTNKDDQNTATYIKLLLKATFSDVSIKDTYQKQ